MTVVTMIVLFDYLNVLGVTLLFTAFLALVA